MVINGGTSSSRRVRWRIDVSTQRSVRRRTNVSTQRDCETPQSEILLNAQAVDSAVRKQAKEKLNPRATKFRNSLSDEEIYILEEYGEFSWDSDISCSNFTKPPLPVLVPKLLEMLLKHVENQYKSPWDIEAGGTRLGLVARTVGDDIVPLVMPFIRENISKPDWCQREVATHAFGCILEGPSLDKLVPHVKKYLWSMLNSLKRDPNNLVRETSAWTLGRMFKFLHGSALDPPIITQVNIKWIITALLQSMRDLPNVAEKVCGALYLLAQGYEDAGSTFPPLTPFFQEIVQALLTVTHGEGARESRLRTPAYETLNEVVRCSNDESAPMVMELVPVIMTELDKTLVVNQVSYDDKKQNELCGCLQVIIQKLGSSEPTKYHFMQFADQMMSLFLRMFAFRSATTHEEAMLAIGALAYACGPDFAKHMPEFYKYLELGLQNFEDYQVFAITVGVVGDVCRALEDKILPYCDGIMTQLLKDLSSNQLPCCDWIMTQHRSVKPPIFSCFGDIALAIGENFEKYLLAVGENFKKCLYYAMPVLQIAADDDMTVYINSLRNGILEAYSGIFQGFKGSPKTELLMPYVSHVLQFLDSLYMDKDMDDVVMKTAIGVLGDLADTLGSNAGLLIQQSVSSKDFLKECLSSDDHLIKETAEWAKLAIGRAISF